MLRQYSPFILALAFVAAACGSSDDGAVDTTTGTTEPDISTAEPIDGAAYLSDLEFADPTVTYLQHALAELGYDVGGIDGFYGPATTTAVAAFQSDNGLEATGHMNTETIEELEAQSEQIEHLLVEAIQTQLAELGYYAKAVDGLWGSGSEEAIVAFQESQGIESTGMLDDATFPRLVAAYDAEVIAEHAAASGTEAALTQRTAIPAGQEADYLQAGDSGAEIETLQRRLAELGYRPGDIDGYFSAHTASAVLAFQKREGLQRDAIVGPEVQSRLADPQGAGPQSSEPGPRVEIDLDRQILFAIAADGSVTTINTSTGSGREFQSAEAGKGIVVAHTPVGEFTILRVIDGLREAPLGTLYRPMYFTNEGGFAIHGNPHVPGYPASHGCARTANYDMDFLWDLGLGVDDAVWVYGDNPPAPDNAAGGF